eukprot:scaffold2085_cov263-Pinguiococcus_pyrenoidosus.AAC.3
MGCLGTTITPSGQASSAARPLGQYRYASGVRARPKRPTGVFHVHRHLALAQSVLADESSARRHSKAAESDSAVRSSAKPPERKGTRRSSRRQGATR